jgi:hypothetical protein
MHYLWEELEAQLQAARTHGAQAHSLKTALAQS